jgi:trimethylamine--corrinoid protein Co-methyltransferase
MVLSLEQMLIDTEIFRMCKHAHRGIVSGDDKWLDDVIDQVGPGGNFLEQPSTTNAIRDGEWYLGKMGMIASYEEWEAAGKPEPIEDARDMVDQILTSYKPLPIDEEIERELDRIKKSAADKL